MKYAALILLVLSLTGCIVGNPEALHCSDKVKRIGKDGHTHCPPEPQRIEKHKPCWGCE